MREDGGENQDRHFMLVGIPLEGTLHAFFQQRMGDGQKGLEVGSSEEEVFLWSATETAHQLERRSWPLGEWLLLW